jgi:hypothetical protein
MLIKMPSVLVKLFPLYRRYYILHDSDGDLWLFEEILHDGFYPKYTLAGKTIGKGFTYRANFYCKFICNNEAAIFVEDIITAKRRKRIGTWMFNRLIDFLRHAETAMNVAEVKGHFLPEDEEAGRKFFSRFGFEIRTAPDSKPLIFATIDNLHVVEARGLKEIDFEDVVRQWVEKNL